ncbi:hypothetical protein [Agromyces badenianii]|uniref:hypothetical protein n=1 Tax=Agromyces badenianii TaxID=2080742 RepID=UPI000D59527A|nr:hypothetical protein [Agromyces badenianii]PWC03074.1 hypothetical protein DCE94_12420 [Agromyces badenianii]
MFTDAEWVRLIDKLRQLTEQDKLKWEINSHMLSTTLGGVTYTIASKDRDGVAPWTLTVAEGSDPWASTQLDRIMSIGGPETQQEPRSKVAPLREAALRQAVGAAQLLDNLLADLNELDPTEPPTYGDDIPF